MTEIVALDALTIDPAIQLKSRGVDSITVQSYVEAIGGGAEFPPVVAFSENGNLWLADGFHRVAALRFCGATDVGADVKEGTLQDAMIHAATANAEHGKPMTRTQKNEAGWRLIALRHEGQLDATKWTDAYIAQKVGAGRQSVGRWVTQFLDSLSLECPFGPFDDDDQQKSPRLIVGRAEWMPQVEDEIIDLIITSPPYNMGRDSWPMGGEGRMPRDEGIGYKRHQDTLSDETYQEWQVAVCQELYRVARPGASFFYNHKVRNQNGELIHPLDWLRDGRNPWTLRQEIIWDRGSTHNHSASLFWPEDERVYWMTKGKPTLPDRPIGMSTVWRFHGPVAGTWHPAPFCEELPRRCMEAVGRDGITVLDPFAGSCTTLQVALECGYEAIGVDVSIEYLERARIESGWTRPSET